MKDRKTNQTTSDQMMECWDRKSKGWKKQGIPLDFTVKQAIMEFDMYRLGVNSEAHQKLQEIQLNRKEDEVQIKDIKERFPEFVDAEKANISDQVFAKIDKLKAKLNSLKSRRNELKKYKSILNKKFNNGSKKAA